LPIARAAQSCVAGSEARPPKSTAHDYLMLWDWDGTLERIQHALYLMIRGLEDRSASSGAGVIDSQSVKSAESWGRAWPPGL
jgi:hypothetical protein